MSALIEAARNIAIRAHAGQFYPPEHGPIEFSMHLGHVVSVLHRFDVRDEIVVAAAWLHDVLEDTTLTPERLRMLHTKHLSLLQVGGEDDIDMVLNVVVAVTDGEGETRAERKRSVYPKIVANGYRAMAVKLADRIANVEASLLGGRGKDFLGIYKREHEEFVEALRSIVAPPGMWDYLNTIIHAERVA